MRTSQSVGQPTTTNKKIVGQDVKLCLTTWVRFYLIFKVVSKQIDFLFGSLILFLFVFVWKFQLNNKLFSLDVIGILIWFWDGWGNCVVVSFRLKEKFGQEKIVLSHKGWYFLRLNTEKMKDVVIDKLIFHSSMKLMKDNCILWLFTNFFYFLL